MSVRHRRAKSTRPATGEAWVSAGRKGVTTTAPSPARSTFVLLRLRMIASGFAAPAGAFRARCRSRPRSEFVTKRIFCRRQAALFYNGAAQRVPA